jgi:hypothetical protein
MQRIVAEEPNEATIPPAAPTLGPTTELRAIIRDCFAK